MTSGAEKTSFISDCLFFKSKKNEQASSSPAHLRKYRRICHELQNKYLIYLIQRTNISVQSRFKTFIVAHMSEQAISFSNWSDIFSRVRDIIYHCVYPKLADRNDTHRLFTPKILIMQNYSCGEIKFYIHSSPNTLLSKLEHDSDNH